MARTKLQPNHVTLAERRALFAAGKLRELRLKLGLNQADFWTPISVQQSGGSRYESGRDVPAPVMHLMRLYWVESVDFRAIFHHDVSLTLLAANHA